MTAAGRGLRPTSWSGSLVAITSFSDCCLKPDTAALSEQLVRPAGGNLPLLDADGLRTLQDDIDETSNTLPDPRKDQNNGRVRTPVEKLDRR